MNLLIAAIVILLILGGALLTGLVIGRRRLLRAGLPRLSAVMLPNPRAMRSEKNGETIIHLEGQTEGLALNSVAGKVWEMTDGTRTIFRIARAVASEYKVPLARAVREVRSFSRRLKLALLALEPQEWDLLHVHQEALFARTDSRGVVEVPLGPGLFVHAATCLQGADGILRPWRGEPLERRAGAKAMRRHLRHEAPLQEAAAEFKKGWDLCAAGRLEESLEAFRHCTRAAPRWANAWYQTGYVQLRLMRYQEAAHSFKEADTYSPGLFMVREYLDQAVRLASGGLSHEAFLLFDKANSVGLKDPEATIRLARKALHISPHFPSARLILARAYAKQELFHMALEELDQTIKMNPDPATLCHALLSRGTIFQSQGRPEMALREWEKVIELNGSATATRTALASMASADWVH